MEISKQEGLRIMQLWNQSEQTLRVVFDKLLEEYVAGLARQTTEWETLRQSIEFSAKKQVLLDLKKVLSKDYATTTGQSDID